MPNESEIQAFSQDFDEKGNRTGTSVYTAARPITYITEQSCWKEAIAVGEVAGFGGGLAFILVLFILLAIIFRGAWY